MTMIQKALFVSAFTTMAAGFRPASFPFLHHSSKFFLQETLLTMNSSNEPDFDEPLSVMFQRGVVLQRMGDYESALSEYEMFVEAAKQCDVSPQKYAEVHGNIGAVHMKRRDGVAARRHFEEALRHREIGSTHVNLALLTLKEGSTTSDPSKGFGALKAAETHCRRAIALDDDSRSGATATKLLSDIEGMIEQAAKGSR
eukprot:CAMPEP_0195527700 /NCGR_PEP_ID=MMETSP0794_2-20130614/29570_1 /TAXON_ID=515487 /ORGANISM="Stephanopyxis turris, Strain CCMP 815" /LENGTH=198 /DNA_ID=CAMNT_0040658677 /DNA_START=33 /DNA_END=629 /DNA_ORIENTATION=+